MRACFCSFSRLLTASFLALRCFAALMDFTVFFPLKSALDMLDCTISLINIYVWEQNSLGDLVRCDMTGSPPVKKLMCLKISGSAFG